MEMMNEDLLDWAISLDPEVLEFAELDTEISLDVEKKRKLRARLDEHGNFIKRERVDTCGMLVTYTDPTTGALKSHRQYCGLPESCSTCHARAAENMRMQAEGAFYGAGQVDEPLYMLEVESDDPINATIFEHILSKDRKSFPVWNPETGATKYVHFLRYPMHETRTEKRHPIEGVEDWPLVEINEVETIRSMDFSPYAVTIPGKKVSGKLGGTKASVTEEFEKVARQICEIEVPELEVEEAELIHKKVASLTNHMEPKTIAEAVALANERSMMFAEFCRRLNIRYEEKWRVRYLATDENLTIDWRWYNIKCKFFVEADEEKLAKIAARFKK